MVAFAVWMTTFIKQYEEVVVSLLISKGYAVSAYSGDFELSTVSKPPNEIAVISVKAEKKQLTETHKELYNLIKSAFFEQSKSYYSLIVQNLSDVNLITWGPGQIFIPELEENKSTGSPYRDSPKGIQKVV